MLGERATLGLNFGKTALYTARFTGEKKKASRELKGIKDFLMAADVTDAKTNQVLADHLWLAIPIKKSRLIGKGDLFEFRAKVTMYMNKEEGGNKARPKRLAGDKDKGEMRNLIKWQLINERGRRSELSGERLDEPLDESVEMHEVFVSRDMVRAWPEDRKKLIFHHYNMVILKQSEHKVATSKGNRAILAKKLIARYGKASIQEWLDGLGLKYRLELSQWD